MGVHKTFQRLNRTRFRSVALVTACIFAGLFAFFSSSDAYAATTLPTMMNFQGRVTNNSGSILSNGTYNMRFKIWSASTSGSQLWSEDRLVSASQGVTVTNGMFSVQLGSVTTLPASVFASNSLYFEVELPTPATATSSSPSWTEGAMTPRNQLLPSAYAYNSETLDGLDSAAFAQIGATNAFTGANSFDVASASALQVKSGAAVLLNADTTNSRVTIGTSDTTGSVLVLDTKTGSGDPTGGSATNGAMYYNSNAGKFRCYQNGAWYDCLSAGQTKQVSLEPEYAGATFTGDGTNNTGSLSSDFCSGTSRLSINTANCAATNEFNYYQWTTTQATAQDYDLYVRLKLPSDYATGSMTNLTATAWGTTTASESAVLSLFSPGSATACTTTSNLVTANATWATSTTASPLGACTLAAGDTVTIRIRLLAGQNKFVRMSQIGFSYVTSY